MEEEVGVIVIVETEAKEGREEIEVKEEKEAIEEIEEEEEMIDRRRNM